MSYIDIIRAWKDDDYLESLNEEEKGLVPENPAGIIELSDREMQCVNGGFLEQSFACVNVNVNNNFNVNITVGAGASCPVSNASFGCIFQG
jgi:mersacidin/lichenicidin family type 2 lantibiotic